MKKPILVVIGLIVFPLVLALVGSALAWLFSCTGGAGEITTCSVPALTSFISGLVSMVWLSAFAAPLGMVAIGIILIWSLLFGESESGDKN